MMKRWHSFPLFVILICLALLMSCTSRKRSARPNIIFIYADDLGIGLLGHAGQVIITTPNIDKLAQEGIHYRNACSNMLSAPARASLITGLHDCHADGFRITDGNAYRNANESNLAGIESAINSVFPAVPAEQVFLGEVAQRMGYKTAQFGKLEWGFSSTDQQMKRHGWDDYFGYLDHVRAHGFYPPFLFENGRMVEIKGNTHANCGKSREPETAENFAERHNMEGKEVYSQNLFMDRILQFIESNKTNPFFLYFPTQLPHGPVSIPAVHPDFVNDERLTPIEKEYASMVKLLDDHVGQIMQKVKELDLDENTIIIFAADNGHEIYYSQEGRVLKPYTNMETGERFDDCQRKFYSREGGDVFNGNGGRAGLKRSNLQGGINVPLIVRWPGTIAGGRTSERLVAGYDLLPTLADMTGYTGDFHTDGISFYQDLLGNESVPEHEWVVYSSFTGPALVTGEGWKIRTVLKKNVFELYYLPDDFREANDLSLKFPEKLEELKQKLLEACDGDYINGLYDTRNEIPIPKTTANEG